MANNKNKKNTPDTPNADATAAADAPKKDRKPAGSSIAAQAKALVLSIHTDLKESVKGFEGLDLRELLPTSYETLEKFALDIAETQNRGLPLSVKLEGINAQIAEHYAAAPVVDGKMSFDQAWNDKLNDLNNRKTRVEAAMKKEKEGATEKADTETSGADAASDAATA